MGSLLDYKFAAMLHYPRVLFLTPCAFNAVTGGGVTFTNLFRGWPRDRLATVTDDPVPVSREVCDQYFFLGDEELRYIAPFHWLRRRTKSQQLQATSDKPTDGHPWTWARNLGKKLIGTASIPDRGRLSDGLRRWLDRFQPDLIYTILGTPGYFDLLKAIARYCHLPFVIHIMDHGTIDPVWTGLFG